MSGSNFLPRIYTDGADGLPEIPQHCQHLENLFRNLLYTSRMAVRTPVRAIRSIRLNPR